MWKFVTIFPCLLLMLWGQQNTRVSLLNQAKDLDFSTASRVRPFPIGSQLPATCVVGEAFFRTDVAAGQNLFACVSTNVWSPQGYATVLDPGFIVARTANNTLTIGQDCSSGRPCLVRIGSQVRSFTQAATLVVSGSNLGSVYIYVSAQGNITVGATPQSTLSLNCTNCTVGAQISDFPVDSLPLFQWNVGAAATWDTNGTDRRAVLSVGRRFLAGSNITIAESGADVTISSNNFMPNNFLINGGSLRLGSAMPTSTTEPLFGLGNPLVGGSANGTSFGINTASTFTGDFAHWMKNGVSVLRWGSDGSQTATSSGQTVTWTGNGSTTSGSGFRLTMAGTGASHLFRLGAGSRDYFQSNGTGATAIGRTAATPNTADLLVQDATATTGSTQFQVRSGSGQDRDLIQVLDNGGTVLSRISQTGATQVVTIPTGATNSALQLGSALVGASANGTAFGINTSAAFTGDFAQWMKDGASVLRWGVDGSQTATSSGQTITWNGNSSTAASSSFRLSIGGTASTNTFRLTAGSRDYFQSNGTGAIAVGRTAATPGTADLLVQDATATTGTTQLQVRAGAGQDRDLVQVLDNAGTVISRISQTGAAQVVNIPTGATSSALQVGSPLVGASANGTAFGINTGAAFTGDFANFMKDGASLLRWGVDGSQTATSSGQTITWTGNGATAASSSFRLAIGGTASTNTFRLTAGSRDYFQSNGTGAIAIGRTAATPGTADLLVQDATATTGTTQLQVRGGAGQDRDLVQVLDNSGSVLARVTQQGALRMLPSGSRPTCDVNARGLIWFTSSAATVADKIEVCVKLANDSYSWTALF